MKNISIVPKSLSQIIKKKTGRNALFIELDNCEKGDVISYIYKNNLSIQIFGKRGYNVLKKQFFVFEYVYSEGLAYSFKYEIKYFPDFGAFFEYLKGSVYELACFYGYSFSDEEIKQYKINIKEINFDAFIDYDIDQDSFETLTNNKKQEHQEAKTKIKHWIESFSKIKSYETFLEVSRDFESSKEYFFSLLIQSQKEEVKDYFVEYISEFGQSAIRIDDILFYYGFQAAEDILNHYDGGYHELTKLKHKRIIKKKIELFKNFERIEKRRGCFDEENQLYLIEYLIYEKDFGTFISVKKYFVSFDNFANELNDDLSDVDLSKTELEKSQIEKYKTNENTLFPPKSGFSDYKIIKSYLNNRFIVNQKWLDEKGNQIADKVQEFEFFCDFVHYLKKDLSNADFLMCDEIENIVGLNDLNIKGAKVRSNVAKKMGLSLNLIPKDKYKIAEFKEAERSELATVSEFLFEREDDKDYPLQIAYISDIHLLHQYANWKCETLEDVQYVTRKITNEINQDESRIKLITGDIASDLNVYKFFISKLSCSNQNKFIFLTLGNHELWPFENDSLNKIVSEYRNIVQSEKIYLVHNNLYYFEDESVFEIPTTDLESISDGELREKMRKADLILFGGLGFAGKNALFNANQGIYRNAISREQEINESILFEYLYSKVAKALFDKNVIVLTHMPMKDWAVDDTISRGFVYVNGHNHRNYFFDDGVKRIYSDNQIGYKQKSIRMKHLSLNYGYDWFSDYKDGIYEITRDDYDTFYRGINKYISFNRDFQKLYMLKREKTYMFLMTNKTGNLQVLNGGAIKRAGGHSIEYYYENLVSYAKSVKMFLASYDTFQKSVSKEIKEIGGDGCIHGSIVDVDYYNHIYLNPLDGAIIPYFAFSMTEKFVYKNIPSLLKNKCPHIYVNYKQKYIENGLKGALVPYNADFSISEETKHVESTEMYRVSRVLNGLQFTTKYNVVRLWSTALFSVPSEEIGRLIVEGIIYPEKEECPQKTGCNKEKKDKPKRNPIVMKRDWTKREEKYRNKVSAMTETIKVLKYNGSQISSEYKCELCGFVWKQRPDHFKECGAKCPNCNK